MKMTNAIVAVFTALTLGGCYWVPPQAQSGAVSLQVSLPRSVLPPGYTGDALRAYLYDADEVSADFSVGIPLTATGNPIRIEGYDYFETPFVPAATGSFAIADIASGRKYRLHLQWGYLNGSGNFSSSYQGLSDPFEVVAGGVVDVAIDLYFAYI